MWIFYVLSGYAFYTLVIAPIWEPILDDLREEWLEADRQRVRAHWDEKTREANEREEAKRQQEAKAFLESVLSSLNKLFGKSPDSSEHLVCLWAKTTLRFHQTCAISAA